MQNEEISFQGRRDKIDELLGDLSNIEGITDVAVKSVSSVPTGILGREPLNQFEIADIVISITTNLVSAMLYDQLRQKINELAKNRGFIQKQNRANKQQRKFEDDF